MNHSLCEAVLSIKESQKMLRHHVSESAMHPFVKYACLETLQEKIDSCENNLKRSFGININKNRSYGFAMSIICLQ